MDYSPSSAYQKLFFNKKDMPIFFPISLLYSPLFFCLFLSKFYYLLSISGTHTDTLHHHLAPPRAFVYVGFSYWKASWPPSNSDQLILHVSVNLLLILFQAYLPESWSSQTWLNLPASIYPIYNSYVVVVYTYICDCLMRVRVGNSVCFFLLWYLYPWFLI